jgi:hypothetical protein
VRLQYVCERFGSKNSLGPSGCEQVEAMGKYESLVGCGEGEPWGRDLLLSFS